MIGLWENRSEAAQWWNTERPLTHPLDLGEEGIAMQATRICTVAGCDKPRRSKVHCAAHHSRWKRYGDPTAGRLPVGSPCTAPACDRANVRRGLCGLHAQRMERNGTLEIANVRKPCVIEGCDQLGMARGWCRLHYERWQRNGDPIAVGVSSAMLPGELNCKWQGEEIGYTAAHDRVRKAYGSARGHSCVDCNSSADGWSYDHGDPDERKTDAGIPYSTKLEHYQARCNPCHWKIDHPTGKPTRA